VPAYTGSPACTAAGLCCARAIKLKQKRNNRRGAERVIIYIF